MTDSMLLPLLTLPGLRVVGLNKLAALIAVLVMLTAVSLMIEPLFNELFTVMLLWFLLLFFARIVIEFAGRDIRDFLADVAADSYFSPPGSENCIT